MIATNETNEMSNAGHDANLQPCSACNGRGSKQIGYVHIRMAKCFTCNGTGQVNAKRKAAAKKGRETRAKNVADGIKAIKAAHPAEYALLQSNTTSSFILDLRERLNMSGKLSERQVAALTKIVEGNSQRREAATVDLGDGPKAMFDAVMKAKLLGTKRPKFRTEHIVITVAPDHGSNAGHLYVKSANDEYLGKINAEGKFQATRACTDELRKIVIDVSSDPLTAAVDYGRRTGSCACCGRELVDEVSVADGIGPICKQKFF